MKPMRRAVRLAWLPVVCLAMAGCRTPDPNPPTPRAHTGYVDFHADEVGLIWEVKLQEPSGKLRTVYSKFEPVPGTTLRIPAEPGARTYQVWFMNRATTGPKLVEVQVEDGKVTPVRVSLVSEGTVSTNTKEYRFGGSAKGYGRGTRIVTDTGELYRIDAVPAVPEAYRVKEQMPYWKLEMPPENGPQN